ncbi:hypothetical protein ABQE93_02125 [Mycolicibacterium sp. XJ662]
MLRVIQWAAGGVGTEMVTTILDHRPDLQPVGARVYSDAEDGVDVGTLVGRQPIGVTVATDGEPPIELETPWTVGGDYSQHCQSPGTVGR